MVSNAEKANIAKVDNLITPKLFSILGVPILFFFRYVCIIMNAYTIHFINRGVIVLNHFYFLILSIFAFISDWQIYKMAGRNFLEAF